MTVNWLTGPFACFQRDSSPLCLHTMTPHLGEAISVPMSGRLPVSRFATAIVVAVRSDAFARLITSSATGTWAPMNVEDAREHAAGRSLSPLSPPSEEWP